QERTDLVADYPVQQAAGLLSVDEILVDVGWVLKGFLYRFFCDLVEQDPANGFAVLAAPFEFFLDVPADGFALAIGVGCDVDRLGFLCGGLEFLYYLFLAGDDFVGGLKLVLKIDADALLWQVFYVSNRGKNLVASAQVLIDRLRLRR